MFEFKAILSVEAAMVAVERNGEALRYVPDELKSEAVCAKAVESSGYALQYVPDELKSEAVCAKAVERDGDALRYVLKKSLFISIAAKFGISIDIKDPNEKAIKAYAAYCKQAGGITFDGKPLPTFEDLGEDRQQCWVAATDAMVE